MSGPSRGDLDLDRALVPDSRPAPSRRRVLLGAAGAGAVGLAAAAVASAGPAFADTSRTAASSAHDAGDTGHGSEVSEPVVVHLRDAQSGELDIFAGTTHTRLRDPDLAARLARAAR
jgi:hypothetical protein